jgi:hypothetical protein
MADRFPLTAALIGFSVVLFAAAGCGMAVLSALRANTDSAAERFVMGSAVGLGLLAYAVLAVGLLGHLRPPLLLILVLIEAAIGARSLGTWLRSVAARTHHSNMATPTGIHRDGQDRQDGKGLDHSSNPVDPVHPCEFPPRLRASVVKRLPTYAGAALVLFCLFVVACTLVGALAPPTGDDWDSLSYHLAAPKIYLAHGRIDFIPYDSHTNFPFTMEMLYTLGLVCGGAAGAKLFHWAAGWLTALGIAAFCRRLFPERGTGVVMPVWAPPLAAALFLSIPQVQWQATTAYIDLGTTLYQFLALVAFVYSVSPSLRGEPSDWASVRGSLIVSGLMSGWAMGTKMTAMLPFGLLVLAAVLWAAFSASRLKAQPGSGTPSMPSFPHPLIPSSAAWSGVALLALAGVLVACPWYVKSFLWTHNPVYPFFYSLFPHSVGWTREAEIAYQHEQHFFGLGRGVWALLMVPWNLAMQGWAYLTVPTRWAPAGTLPYFDGLRRGGLSATFLALVPLALYTRRWDRRLTGLVVYGLALILPWFVLSQQSRYLLPITAPLAVVAAAVVANLEVDLPRWAAGAFVVITLFLHGRWGWDQIVGPTWPVVSGQVTQAEYLQHAFPPYDAMRYVNTLPAGTKVAFYQETRGFYLNRDYLWANPLQNTLIPYHRLRNGAELVRFLKTHLGVTHVLVNTTGEEGTEKTPWYLLLNNAISHNDLIPVFAARGVEVYAIP